MSFVCEKGHSLTFCFEVIQIMARRKKQGVSARERSSEHLRSSIRGPPDVALALLPLPQNQGNFNPPGSFT